MSASRYFDLFVAGSGPAGASLACLVAAAHPHLRVAVADAAVSSRRPPSAAPDCRVLALSPASTAVLGEAGVWERALASGRVAPFYGMAVWDASGPGQIRFSAGDAGRGALGFVAENWLVHELLHERMRELPNVTLLEGRAVAGVALPPPGDAAPAAVTLAGEEGAPLETGLLACCDGAGSPVARLAGLGGRVGWRYPQQAVVCAVRLADGGALSSTAYQRFLPGGQVLALLPMHDGFASVVWSTSPAHARQLAALSEADFLAHLRRSLTAPLARPSWLGELVSGWSGPAPVAPEIAELAGPRAAFPLQASQAEAYVGSRVALAGDAAHTMHPLAGQGFNLGLSDVACLARLVGEAVRDGQDPGGPQTLAAYQAARYRDNAVAVLGVDALQKIFSVNWEPFVVARGGEIV
jgi:ubiquinone biosynthesis UbiH/UbiF/VisC/COQ6 family hydroxylase